MNICYKIIELGKILTDLQNKSANTKPFISPDITASIIIIIVLSYILFKAILSQSLKDISVATLMFVLTIVLVPITVKIVYKSINADKVTLAENKSKQEAYKKQILELYNNNKDLFDNKNLTNVNDIINEAKKRKKIDSKQDL